MASVYVDTTIPSAYVTTRLDPRSVAQREDTRLWWRQQRPAYNCLVSQEVIDELLAGAFEGRSEAMENTRHLANPNKLQHLTTLNRRLALLTPAIVTPETLWLEET